MAAVVKLPYGKWTKVANAGFESTIFQTEHEQVVLEFSVTAPPEGEHLRFSFYF